MFFVWLTLLVEDICRGSAGDEGGVEGAIVVRVKCLSHRSLLQPAAPVASTPCSLRLRGNVCPARYLCSKYPISSPKFILT